MLKKDEKVKKKKSLLEGENTENHPKSSHNSTPRLVDTVLEAVAEASNLSVLKQIDPSG